MVSQAGYSGRRYSRAYPQYMTIPERRYHMSSSHEAVRGIPMADSHIDTDSQPQRKRIAVACGRCRKRKIRCSGDPGGGQPCSNCKNAGSDQPCMFLRVQSTEAPLRQDTNEFAYSVQDARAYASRSSISQSVQYPQDIPSTVNSSEVLSAYRGGSTYGYGTKHFYPAMPSYSAGYPVEYIDYGLNCQAQPVLNHDSVNMMPYPWSSSSRAAKQAATGPATSVYVDPEATYAYGNTTGLVQRQSAADSPNFSFSHMAANLPVTATTTSTPINGSSDRLLPTPTSKSLSSSCSSTLPPYASLQSIKAAAAAAVAAGTMGPHTPPLSNAGTPNDPDPGYLSTTFDTSGLPYSSPSAVASTTATASSLSLLSGTHTHNHTLPPRTIAVGYSTQPEALFPSPSEDHTHRQHGPGAIDLGSYAYADPTAAGTGPVTGVRRGSRSSSHGSSGPGIGVNGYGAIEQQQQQQQQQHDEEAGVAVHGHVSQHQGHHHHYQNHNPQHQHQQNPHSHRPLNHLLTIASGPPSSTTYLPSDAPITTAIPGTGTGHADTRQTAVGPRR